MRRALLVGAGAIAVALIVTFTSFQLRTERLLYDRLVAQARAFSQQILATRRFVTASGGVYVPASSEASGSPHLVGMTHLDPEIFDRAGERYVLLEPAAFIDAVAGQLERYDGMNATFRLVGSSPIDPANSSDPFEREALAAFERGAGEYYTLTEVNGSDTLRYVYPLRMERGCLTCHTGEGFEPGEVGGGIAVQMDAEATRADVLQGRFLTAVALAGSLGTLLLFLYLIVTRLLAAMLDAERRLSELANVDPLTGLDNRRVALERLAEEIDRSEREESPLSVLMVDLDHFKGVNDRFGHAAGDAVLVAAAYALASEARTYDTVARTGGEEFLVLLPGIDEQSAAAVAERMRARVAEMATSAVPSMRSTVTASVGVATLLSGRREGRDALLSRADRAMYVAKKRGRDRVMVA